MIKQLQNLFHTFFSIGADYNTSKNELKKIKSLNLFCFLSYLFFTIDATVAILNNYFIILNSSLVLLSIITIHTLQYYKKYLKARFLFILHLTVSTFIYSNFVDAYKASFLEFLFVFPPCISLIFFNNKKINLIVLFISFGFLFIPNIYFEHYPIHIFNHVNIFIYYFSIYSIISYFKNLNLKNENTLEERTQELEELDKFKSQFFTNISHEIRTPLTLVNGYVSNLEFAEKRIERKEIKQRVKKQINKITNIVDSVLDLAKMQSSNFSLQLKTANVSLMLRKQYMSFEPLFNQKNIDFNIKKNNVDYFSSIDIVFFEKAINNLIINALKYTEKGKVDIEIYEKNKKLIIKISDTGIGVSKANLETIFNQFYQVNNDINKSGGSGIGLAFCKEIIELHHGTMHLKSELHKGSEFSITLPLVKSLPTLVTIDKNSLKKEVNNSEKTIVKTSKFHFLIVDDNYDMRKYLISILEQYNCYEATNGNEALDIINNKTIHFIITDYMMPKLNGYNLISKLNHHKRNIPIIMLTAKTDINTKLEVLRLGIDDYITKPFDKDELLTRINNCIKNNNVRKSYNTKHNIIDNNEKDNFIQKLETYILENSNNPDLNQDMMIVKFNISKSSFYRKIKSKTGLSPNNFINEIRLQKARNILEKNPTMLLKQVALEVGFGHTYHFTKLYKKRFGIKPIVKK